MSTATPPNVDQQLFASFVYAMLWSETLADHPDNHDPDSDMSPLGLGLDCDDLSPEAIAKCADLCRLFEAECGELVEATGKSLDDAGHDLWMTCRGHGCGFWDGDWPEPHAEQLTKWCRYRTECWDLFWLDGRIEIDG